MKSKSCINRKFLKLLIIPSDSMIFTSDEILYSINLPFPRTITKSLKFGCRNTIKVFRVYLSFYSHGNIELNAIAHVFEINSYC